MENQTAMVVLVAVNIALSAVTPILLAFIQIFKQVKHSKCCRGFCEMESKVSESPIDLSHADKNFEENIRKISTLIEK